MGTTAEVYEYRIGIDAQVIVSVKAATNAEAVAKAKAMFAAWAGGIDIGDEVFGDEADARLYLDDNAAPDVCDGPYDPDEEM